MTIVIEDQLLAGTSGTDEFCEGETDLQNLFDVITDEDMGGAWSETSMTSSGVTVGDGTAIDFSMVLPGVYEYTYSIAASGTCLAASSTATITVTDQLEAGNYVVLAFLSRSYHESVKSEGAYFIENITVGSG